MPRRSYFSHCHSHPCTVLFPVPIRLLTAPFVLKISLGHLDKEARLFTERLALSSSYPHLKSHLIRIEGVDPYLFVRTKGLPSIVVREYSRLQPLYTPIHHHILIIQNFC